MNTKIALVSGLLVFTFIVAVTIALLFSKKPEKSLLTQPTPSQTSTILPSSTQKPIQTLTPTQSPTQLEVQPLKQTQQKKSTMKKGIIATSKGNITVEFYPEETPKTVENFATKAKSNYYKGLTFHRVENWVIQGGDPAGNGTGGGKMPTELSQRPFVIGSVGVARGGDIAVSNDSQFFICTTDCAFLTGQYTNFGTVIEGMDVVKNIAIGDTIQGVSILE